MNDTPEVQWVKLSDLKRDQRVNTRPVDQGWVESKLSEGFDLRKFGTPTLSSRPGGRYIVLDGQNRVALAREAGLSDEKVQCSVFHGLSRDQEAAIFLGLNDSRRVLPIYKFLARVATREVQATSIVKIVESYGWKVGNKGEDGYIQAAAALDYAWSLGPDVLSDTIKVITGAWELRSEGTRSVIIKGIASVVNRYGTDIDLPGLALRLATYSGGPNGIYADARGLHGFRGGTIHAAISEVVVNAYNKGRRAKKLEEWRG